MIVVTAPELRQNCDICLKKRMKESFAYVLEFMLTFDKMQNIILSAFHTVVIVLYIGCSGPVVECLNQINMLQSTTRPLCQNTRYTELCLQYEKLE